VKLYYSRLDRLLSCNAIEVDHCTIFLDNLFHLLFISWEKVRVKVFVLHNEAHVVRRGNHMRTPTFSFIWIAEFPVVAVVHEVVFFFVILIFLDLGFLVVGLKVNELLLLFCIVTKYCKHLSVSSRVDLKGVWKIVSWMLKGRLLSEPGFIEFDNSPSTVQLDSSWTGSFFSSRDVIQLRLYFLLKLETYILDLFNSIQFLFNWIIIQTSLHSSIQVELTWIKVKYLRSSRPESCLLPSFILLNFHFLRVCASKYVHFFYSL